MYTIMTALFKYWKAKTQWATLKNRSLRIPPTPCRPIKAYVVMEGSVYSNTPKFPKITMMAPMLLKIIMMIIYLTNGRLLSASLRVNMNVTRYPIISREATPMVE
jgi:hypothetical protein